MERVVRRARRAETRAHSENQAEQWLTAGLRAVGLNASDLIRLKASDPRKLALAKLLWTRTTVSQDWIAEEAVDTQPRQPATAANAQEGKCKQFASRKLVRFLENL